MKSFCEECNLPLHEVVVETCPTKPIIFYCGSCGETWTYGKEKIGSSKAKLSRLNNKALADKWRFLQDEHIEISLDGSVWKKPDGTPHPIKYRVAVNSTGFSGYDLDEAIELAMKMKKEGTLR
jgi:hypothetical protein